MRHEKTERLLNYPFRVYWRVRNGNGKFILAPTVCTYLVLSWVRLRWLVWN